MTVIALASVLALMALAMVVASIRQRHRRLYGPRTAAQIRVDLHRADAQVGDALRQARRSMNDAAGQSWRNLTG